MAIFLLYPNYIHTKLFVKFHFIGYDIPDKTFGGAEISPDKSIGKQFPKYLEEHYPQYQDDFKKYRHIFPNYNKTVDARQYKNHVLPIFIEYIENE